MKPAVAHWSDGRLYSPQFRDYYAARDPVAETIHVHIQPASMVARMRQAQTFTIFEFGFGAGINFLTISAEFLKQANTDARLRFFSCEAFPLPHDMLVEVLKATSIDRTHSQQLLDFYPPLVSGIYRFLFANDRIEFTLILAPIESALAEFVEQDTVGVDAWILDGFAPDRNPQMWDEKLISMLTRRTRLNGTVTSFSSASSVRRKLEENGFSVQRIDDTPFKRHTTLATLNQLHFQPVSAPRKFAVVGGGFAGTATARALARRGVQVELITTTGSVGDATSGIPTAVVHPRLSASMDEPTYIRTQTYFYSTAIMNQYHDIVSDGIVQIRSKNMSERRLNDIINVLDENWVRSLDEEEFCELSGLNYSIKALFFPKSFVVRGQDFCRRLVEHPQIDVSAKVLHQPILDDSIIFATGSTSLLGEIADCWECLTIEGQIDAFTHANESAIPRNVLIQDGYIVPTQKRCIVGSTYEYTRWLPGLASSSNLNRLQNTTRKRNWVHQDSFRGVRTITSDKLPIVGQVSPNCWVNLAHGSSGTTSTPFCAEILASQICGELAPLWHECIDWLHPNRFKQRQARRPNPFQRPR